MSFSKAFVELNKSDHDRESFRSGKPELDDYLKARALAHMKAGISRTMVLPAKERLPSGKLPICAFYSIAPGQMERSDFPDQLVRRLPVYPVPIFLIAQLAVHTEYHGQGLGAATLIRALRHLGQINAHMRAFAVVVDCLDCEARSFYLKYGFQELCEVNSRLRMFIPMRDVLQL